MVHRGLSPHIGLEASWEGVRSRFGLSSALLPHSVHHAQLVESRPDRTTSKASQRIQSAANSRSATHRPPQSLGEHLTNGQNILLQVSLSIVEVRLCSLQESIDFPA